MTHTYLPLPIDNPIISDPFPGSCHPIHPISVDLQYENRLCKSEVKKKIKWMKGKKTIVVNYQS